MELFRPTYDLEAFKKSKYLVTRSALSGAADMGMDENDIYAAVASMREEHFYKSMTSYRDSRIWQDVYHVPYMNRVLYVKFTKGIVTEFSLLSFKER